MNGETYYNDLPGIEPDEWEVEYSGMAFGQQIGEGAFGTVSKATVVGLMGFPAQKEVVVAVKKLKGKASEKMLVFVARMMKQLTLLNFLSVCISKRQRGRPSQFPIRDITDEKHW